MAKKLWAIGHSAAWELFLILPGFFEGTGYPVPVRLHRSAVGAQRSTRILDQKSLVDWRIHCASRSLNSSLPRMPASQSLASVNDLHRVHQSQHFPTSLLVRIEPRPRDWSFNSGASALRFSGYLPHYAALFGVHLNTSTVGTTVLFHHVVPPGCEKQKINFKLIH